MNGNPKNQWRFLVFISNSSIDTFQHLTKNKEITAGNLNFVNPALWRTNKNQIVWFLSFFKKTKFQWENFFIDYFLFSLDFLEILPTKKQIFTIFSFSKLIFSLPLFPSCPNNCEIHYCSISNIIFKFCLWRCYLKPKRKESPFALSSTMWWDPSFTASLQSIPLKVSFTNLTTFSLWRWKKACPVPLNLFPRQHWSLLFWESSLSKWFVSYEPWRPSGSCFEELGQGPQHPRLHWSREHSGC